jgi:hypothetical protein
MATTWVGSAASPFIAGTGNASNWYLVGFENAGGSGVDVRILRGSIQFNPGSAALTTFMPLVTGYRCGKISGVKGSRLSLPKNPFQTSYSSDPNVNVWTAYSTDGNVTNTITATENGGKGFRNYANRLHTAAEQVLADDYDLIPQMSMGTDGLVLRPGESMIWEIYASGANANSVTAGWFAQFVWQEDTASTYAISGTVTLAGSGVVGAEVTVLVADDTNLTNAYLLGVYTTTTGGAWSANIPTGKVAYAYAQNFSGGTYYTASGAPYIT